MTTAAYFPKANLLLTGVLSTAPIKSSFFEITGMQFDEFFGRVGLNLWFKPVTAFRDSLDKMVG